MFLRYFGTDRIVFLFFALRLPKTAIIQLHRKYGETHQSE